MYASGRNLGRRDGKVHDMCRGAFTAATTRGRGGSREAPSVPGDPESCERAAVATRPSKDTAQFIEAVLMGEEAKARRLFEAKAIDPSAHDAEGATALHYAIGAGRLELVRWLIEIGADVNRPRAEVDPDTPEDSDGATPLMAAAGSFFAKKAGMEILELLLGAGAAVNARDRLGRTALFQALEHPDRLQRLIEAGAEVDARAQDGTTVMLHALLSKNTRAIATLEAAGASKEGARELEFLEAASQGDLERVRALIADGAQVNFRMESTALTGAAQGGHLELVRFLLSAGADPNLLEGDPPDGGFGPLSKAVYSGELEVAKLLLEAGTDPTAENHGISVLDYAKMGQREGRRRSAPWKELVALVRAAAKARGSGTLRLEASTPEVSRALLDALASELPGTKLRGLAALGTALVESAELEVEAAHAAWTALWAPARAAGWSYFLTTRSFEAMEPDHAKLEAELAAMKKLPVERWLKQRLAELDGDDWSEQLAELDAARLAKLRKKTEVPLGAPLDVVHARLCFVQGRPGWAPLLYRFGGWNDAPPPPVQAQMLDRWHERHGAELHLLGRDRLSLLVPRPLELPAVREAAREIGLYCSESEGPWDDAKLAAGSLWHFWWD